MTMIWMLAPASAHGLAAGHGALQLDDHKARLVLAPEASTFPEADDDGDGLLDIDELKAHRELLLDRVRDEIAVIGEDGAAELTLADVLPGVDHHAGTAGHFVKLVLTYTFGTPQDHVALHYELFGPEVDTLELSVATPEVRGVVDLTWLHPVTVLREAP